jgi:hypothetical protein
MYFSRLVRGLNTSSIHLKTSEKIYENHAKSTYETTQAARPPQVTGKGETNPLGSEAGWKGRSCCMEEVYLPLAALAPDVVFKGSANLAFIHKCTVNHPVEETSLKLSHL